MWRVCFVSLSLRDILHAAWLSTIMTVGGFGSAIVTFASENNYHHKSIKTLGIPDNFIEHGKVNELFESVHLSKEAIKNFLFELMNSTKI